MNDKALISDSIKAKIDVYCARFPANKKRSASIYALRLVQDANNNWLTDELMDAVADYLEQPKIYIYEVATFYDMFNLKPVAKHKLGICTNISCMLRGSGEIVDHLKKTLNVDFGEATEDGCFYIREMECLGACAGAPMLQVDDREYHENLTAEKVDELLLTLKKADQQTKGEK